MPQFTNLPQHLLALPSIEALSEAPPPSVPERPRPRRGAATAIRPLSEKQLLERYPDLQAVADSLATMVNVDEAAAALRRAAKTIRGYIDSGKLRASRDHGGRVLIPRVEILRVLARGMQPHG